MNSRAGEIAADFGPRLGKPRIVVMIECFLTPQGAIRKSLAHEAETIPKMVDGACLIVGRGEELA